MSDLIPMDIFLVCVHDTVECQIDGDHQESITHMASRTWTIIFHFTNNAWIKDYHLSPPRLFVVKNIFYSELKALEATPKNFGFVCRSKAEFMTGNNP